MRTYLEPQGVFGCYLEQLRHAHHWTQREVAQKAGMDHTYYYKIVRGIMDPPSDLILQKLSEVFGVPIEELYKRSGKIRPQMKILVREQPLLSELLYALSLKPLPERGYRELLGLVQFYE